MKHFSLALLCAASFSLFTFHSSLAKVPAEPDMTSYVMVYHKDQDHGLHMAISQDGYTWTALNNDQPVISGDTIAVQHGIRDPHIFRGPDGGFYLSMTDLHVFGQRDGKRTTEWERDGAKYGWGNNRGLVLMKSFDLIHWTRTNLDFSILPDQEDMKWSEVGCVWAPETVFDEEAGQLMIHFTVREGKGLNKIYYAYVNNDYNALTSQPKLLVEAPNQAYSIIDSDIIKAGDTYHLFYVSHEKGAAPKHATSQKITGPYKFDELYQDGEKRAHEAPCCWKRIGTDTYVVMFDNYSFRPMNFGFVETHDFFTYHPIGYFDAKESPMKRTNFSEQKHGAVTYLTTAEIQQLEKYWKRPPLTPAWMLGHIAWEDNKNTQAATLELIRQYREHDIPVDGVFIDSPWSMSYNDFIWDKQRYPDAEAMAAQMKEWGVKPILWLTSNVNLTSDGTPQNKCDDYDEMLEKGYAINNGQPSKWWKGTGLQTDFTNPKAKEWFFKRLDRAFTDSFYGFKVDQGEIYFGDTVTTSIGQMTNEQFRQYYYDAIYDYATSRKPGIGGIVARPYSHQGGKHAGIEKMSMGWCGDFGGDWKGLKLQIDNIYRSTQMGFGAVGTEIAGFMGAKSGKQHFIRYTQFGALTACMINGGENGGWTNHLPWWHDKETTDIYRYCVTLHRDLVPYIFSSIVDTHLNGGTLMPQTSLEEESHLLGNDLFTKAITSDNNEVSFHLPANGSWIDYWTGERHAGGKVLNQTYTLDRFPLFVRAGAIIPFTKEGQRTFVIYPDSKSSRLLHLPVGEGTDFFDCQVSCDAKTKRITLKSDTAADWVFIIKGKKTKRLTATGKNVTLKF